MLEVLDRLGKCLLLSNAVEEYVYTVGRKEENKAA